MKTQIIILILVVLFGCKKKPVSTTPEPDPVTCQTGKMTFAGKYRFLGTSTTPVQNGDTIEIVFKNNRCPETDKNDYIIHGLRLAIQNFIKSGIVLPDQIVVKSTDESGNGDMAVVDTTSFSFQVSRGGEQLQFYLFKGVKIDGSSVKFGKVNKQ